jgi:arginine deiminase
MRVKHDADVLDIVLIHQPGNEIEQLTPSNLARLLFDDMPFLDKAIFEHLQMVKYLNKQNITTIEIKDLVNDIIDDKNIKDMFIRLIIHDLKSKDISVVERVKEMLQSLNNKEFIKTLIEGITYASMSLHHKDALFILDPIPNLLFQRDPMFMIDDICVISHMNMNARKRESLISKVIVMHHPLFKHQKVIDMNDQSHSIEGGDVMILGNVIFIGISERTEKEAVIALHKKLKAFNDAREIIMIELPKKRSYMHLDTVFTPLSKIQFVYDKHALNQSQFFKIKENQFVAITQTFKQLLRDLFGNISLIEVGDGDEIYAKREQWNDAANTLAIAPNHVICYDRNIITNQLFKEAGVTFYPMPSSELSRGRGGPHCMTMPLNRKSL